MANDLKKQITITANADGVEAGVSKAKRSLADFGATAASEGKKAADSVAGIGKGSNDSAQKLDAATKNIIGSIQRTTAVLEAGSKTNSRYFETIASQRGVDVSALKPYLDQLDQVAAKQKAAELALNATTPALRNVGMSAAATSAAMRNVPAQFTDIVTSIQGGQQPLTVLLQQGGQLKDMFGGIGPAARALGTYIGGLVTPLTLGAAGVGALAYAMVQGNQESQAWAKAIILSGNSIGKTTDQVRDMAAQIAKTNGTQGEAAEVLAKLAESGKIASTSFEDVGAAVLAMNRVLGTSIDEGTAIFTKLSEEPSKAAAKLNESMHFLTQATYERIRALEEQGDKEAAAALAMSTAANTTTSRMKDIESQSGVLAKAWRLLANDAKRAWDEMQGLGRSKTTGEALMAAQSNLAALQARGPIGGPVTGKSDFAEAMKNATASVSELSRKALREQDAAYAEGQRARDEAAKIAASDRIKRLSDEIQTNSDKRKKAIDELKRDYITLGKATTGAEYEKAVANINEKFKDPKQPKGKQERAYQDDAATKFLETLRQTSASLGEQLAGETKITDAQREQVKFQQLIADLKDKKILTADQKSLLASKDQINAQLAANVGLSNELELKKKIEEINKRSIEDQQAFRREVEAVNSSIEMAAENRKEQFDRALGGIGMGDRARAEIEAQKSIRRDYQRYLASVTKKAGDRNQLDSDEYKKEVEDIKASLAESLAVQQQYFDDVRARQEDWKTGATAALANYSDSVRNISADVDRALSSGFKGAEDALTQFVTTGKGSFKSLADSIISDLARIAVRQSVTGPLAGLLLGGMRTGIANLSDDPIKALYDLSGGFTRAGGGPVSAGKTYLVGEKGPELVVPSTAGTIVPNDKLGTGGGQAVSIVNHWSVGDIPTMSVLRDAIGNSEKRIAGQINRSSRYGGALAS